MYLFLKKYKLIIIIALLILIPLFNLSTSIKAPKDLTWYDRVILGVTSPVQELFTNGFNKFVGLSQNYVFLVHVKKENQRLVTQNQKLIEVVNAMKEIEKENERLRTLLAFKEKYLPSGVTAEVVARDTMSEYQTLRINKGHDVGLKRLMPVMTPSGIVGKLISVWDHYSDVLLLTDRNHSIDAIIQRSRARGIVKGGISPICELHYAARTDDVAVGDILITSGMEGVFPKGILVGSITKVEKASFGVSQKIEVLPAVELGKVEEVFVVTNLSGVNAKLLETIP